MEGRVDGKMDGKSAGTAETPATIIARNHMAWLNTRTICFVWESCLAKDYGGATQSGCCTASGEGSEKLSFTQFRYDLRESSYRCGDDGSCQHAQNGTTLRQCQSMADKVRETHTTTTTTIPEPSSNTFQCLSGQCVPAHTGVGIEKCENLCGSGHGDDFRKGQVVV